MNHVQKRGNAQNIFWFFPKWNKKSSLIIRSSNQNNALRIILDYPHYELLALFQTDLMSDPNMCFLFSM